jgi:hypothetical protein
MNMVDKGSKGDLKCLIKLDNSRNISYSYNLQGR